MADNEKIYFGKTLFVRNLPPHCTNTQLEEIFSEVGPLKQCFVVKERGSDVCKGFGFVKYSLREDADKGTKLIQKLGGRILHITYADKKIKAKKGQKIQEDNINRGVNLTTQKFKKPVLSDQGRHKKCRLIIRNLSFKCKKEDLKDFFSKYGEVSEINIPTKEHGLKLGFGFVQFTSMHGANKAMQMSTGKQLLGRPIAVDWAVPKNKYERLKGQEKSTDEGHIESSDEDGKNNNQDEISSDSETDVEESDDSRKDSDSESEDDNDSTEDESSDSDDDQDDSSNDSNGEMESEEGETSDDEDEEEDANTKKSKKENDGELIGQVQRKTDVEEGKTLFIRNISYDSLEEDLEELFEEFGEINYCKLVVDAETDHSKGLAFVQYKTKESAEKCLAKANAESKGDKLVLDGRTLNVILAVNRNKAKDLKVSSKAKNEKVDKRNLHLVREGLIRPGTQAAEGLSKLDLGKRLKVEKLKRQKLRNPNIFISPLRLCVRNIPVSVTDKQLKQVFFKAVGDKTAKITECRIMRDGKQVRGGVAKSCGYGFIQFNCHEHALEALNKTNNNPALFGNAKRLIVEFSLENKAALEAKQKRIERHKARQELLKNMSLKRKTVVKEDTGKTNVKPKSNAKQPVIPIAPVTNKDKKVPKGLPSHWGPKIRHKPRGPANLHGTKGSKNTKGRAKQDWKVKSDMTRAEEPVKQKPKPKQKKQKRKRKEASDDFDKLVNKYRNKLLQSTDVNVSGVSVSNKQPLAKKSKWFD